MKIQISSKFGTVFLVIVGYLYLNDSSRSEPSEERDNNFVEIRIAREMYVNVLGPLPSPCTAFSQPLSVNSLRLDQHRGKTHRVRAQNLRSGQLFISGLVYKPTE